MIPWALRTCNMYRRRRSMCSVHNRVKVILKSHEIFRLLWLQCIIHGLLNRRTDIFILPRPYWVHTEPISQLYKISFATPEFFDPIVTHSENIQDEVTGLMWFVYTKVLWCLCTQKTFKPSYLMAVSCWWWLLQEITTTTDTQWKFFTTLLSPALNKRFWFTQRGLSLVCKINYITLHHARLW